MEALFWPAQAARSISPPSTVTCPLSREQSPSSKDFRRGPASSPSGDLPQECDGGNQNDKALRRAIVEALKWGAVLAAMRRLF